MTDILKTLRALYEKQGDEIEHWFGEQRGHANPYFYTSVDLRHSGFRLAPVDTNLYPAGFNNLSLAARARASRYAAHYLSERLPQAKRLVIVPENHTRNLGYLENLAVLTDILIGAGYETRIASLANNEPAALATLSGRTITQIPFADAQDADAFILNNDCTGGIPPALLELPQPILPPPQMGWYRRRKSVHFAAYKTLAEHFATRFSLDPWLIAADSHGCGMIDFKEKSGLECVAKAIDEMLARSRKKYAQYGISGEPYAFIKADSGTYGMGIMTVKSGAEMLELNKKERNKMQVVKEGARVSEVIIQDGIPTIDAVDGKPAEPMVYMIDGLPVGGMYRVNGQRDTTNNLNAAGMEFVGMCDERETSDTDRKSVRECDFRAYGIVAAIAALAAAQETYPSPSRGEAGRGA
ncbi:MAG: glutamate--cysteine ligase [Alphaproteobacteria bacterium]|nr:glutamate--cysteine ligase [Alphaproteobacteria bacterium]